jgi:hypothetical protein
MRDFYRGASRFFPMKSISLIALIAFVALASQAETKKPRHHHKFKGPSAASFASCKERAVDAECSYTSPTNATIQGRCYKAKEDGPAACLPNGISPAQLVAPPDQKK